MTTSVTGLYRHAVKGLSADTLDSVTVRTRGETFPDDRRFALLKAKNANQFDPAAPEWLHKGNFLCSFSDPVFMANYRTTYSIRLGGPTERSTAEGDDEEESFATPIDIVDTTQQSPVPTQRLLTVHDRGSSNDAPPLLGPIDLGTKEGRAEIGAFFSKESGSTVLCVSAEQQKQRHTHQFGNTSSGVKALGDTRTIHIVNAATVRELGETIGRPLNPSRFRPNMVVDGLEPWKEFDWVGKELVVTATTTTGNDDDDDNRLPMRLSVLKRTVRCEGISIDPTEQPKEDGTRDVLDMPSLLSKHYPQHGPFFGVYAAIIEPGTVRLGDCLIQVEERQV